ncbi:low-temperature-induced 65 kDa protein [Malania oleifera]|uniref:low-temperature-induced 65 kDa protein n=1 Tax=Malania oleifera TaxID=397392 RepID=UPI0025AE488E|nr:low-temperature-induced 65 kDa protein [Malania oleifera]
MASDVTRADRSHEGDPHNLVLRSAREGEGDEHQHGHEKKSLMKKVKDKAKRIKGTIKGHGHDQQDGNDHDLDYDEDEAEAQDPEIHGAPIYGSTVVRSRVAGQEEKTGQPLGRSRKMEDDATGGQGTEAKESGGGKSPVRQEEIVGKPRGCLESMELEEDPHAPKQRPQDVPPSNYQSKVPDPTGAGGEEAGITPIISSFGKMKVSDEPGAKPEQQAHTGSHDQLSPEPLFKQSTPAPEQPQPADEVADSAEPEDQQQEDKPKQQTDQQRSYTEKISSATSAIADKAVSAKNTVASKLRYGAAEPRKGASPKGQDVGRSVKEYWAENLRPGDEDRALSDVISEALHKTTKEEPGEGDPPKAVGKVTESEEVRRQLGTGKESGGGEGADSGGVKVDADAIQGSWVVDKLKGAVTPWFGGGESVPAGASGGAGQGKTAEEGERRLQESGN